VSDRAAERYGSAVRRTANLAWLFSAVLGAAVAVLGVLVSYWWGRHHHVGQVGQPRRYVDYLQVTTPTDWPSLLIPAAITGAILGPLLLVVIRLAARRTRSDASR
jgi:hypothetical protein